jgi:ribosomal protein S24E
MKRREVQIVVGAESNPGFANSAKIVAEKFKSDENTVRVNNVKGRFGAKEFTIDAYIYSSEAEKVASERKKKVEVKNG